MTTAVEFKPTEIWTPQSASFELGEEIEAARREMNQHDPDQLIDGLKHSVQRSQNGIVFAVLKGKQPEEYSDTDALVMFNPFANTATPNMLVRAEFIREVAKQADVRDEQGKLKPVIMLASPGIHGSRLNLTKEERNQIRKGDLGPAAWEFLKAISAQEYGRVALLGFSQGADMATAAAKDTYPANLDLDGLAIGEPAGVMERRQYELGLDFIRSGGQFQQAIKQGNLVAQKKVIGKNSFSPVRNADFIRFGATALTPTNRAIWDSLSKNKIEDQLSKLLAGTSSHKVVVAYGGQSHISRLDALEPSLARLHEEATDNRLISIKVEGKDHSWGDQLPLLAKLYLKALV